MGRACIGIGGVAIALFIGYATVPPTTASWVSTALWWGFIVAGVLFFLAGVVYLVPITNRHLNPLDILDDIQCTYWTKEKQIKVTLWFRDYSNSPISEFSCITKFEKQIADVNDKREINGTYLSLSNASYGKSRPIMVEFFKYNIAIDNPNKAIITVSMKPEGLWATKKMTKEIDVQVINRQVPDKEGSQP